MPDAPITSQEFHDGLMECLCDKSAHELLDIPGVYELLAEHFNNEAIEIARDRKVPL